jgi:hypothetical protein
MNLTSDPKLPPSTASSVYLADTMQFNVLGSSGCLPMMIATSPSDRCSTSMGSSTVAEGLVGA